MTAIKVSNSYFQGSGRIWDRSVGLGPIIRGIAIDNARLAIAVAAVLDFTDSSTGTDATLVANVVLPTAVVDASGSAVGAPKTGLDTATGKLDNAFAVIAQNINIARTRLGLPVLTYTGTVATPGTIPACDKTLTAVSGTSAATLGSVRASLGIARDNVSRLTFAMNEVFVATGFTPLVNAITGERPANIALVDIPAATASADGADAASDTVVDAALTAIVANIATLAAEWNTNMSQASQATTPMNVVAG